MHRGGQERGFAVFQLRPLHGRGVGQCGGEVGAAPEGGGGPDGGGEVQEVRGGQQPVRSRIRQTTVYDNLFHCMTT